MTDNDDISMLVKDAYIARQKAENKSGCRSALGWATGLLTVAGTAIFAGVTLRTCFMAKHAFPAYYQNDYSIVAAISGGLTVATLVGGTILAGYLFQKSEDAKLDSDLANTRLRELRDNYPNRVPENLGE